MEPAALRAFLSLDLIRLGDFSGVEQYYTPVLFYPVEGFWIASDRPSNPDGSEYAPPPDVVFPAIYPGTLVFLRLMPRNPSKAALDLCAGSGIGALVLSRSSEHAVSSDLTQRAAHFAHFNRLLNGCENVEIVSGDLYDAVRGRTFDCISAHPPYVPAVGENVSWRDGGETGESIVRRIIEGLPDHLRPGGTLHMVCMGLDTTDGPFEERARQWLGASQSEFDILFGFSSEKSPKEVAANLARIRKDCDASTIADLEHSFETAQVSRLVYGALLVRRRARSDFVPWTRRVRMSSETAGSDLERAIALRGYWTSHSSPEIDAACRPRLSPNLRVRVTHGVVQGVFVPREMKLETLHPFVQALKVPPIVVLLLADFNGESTVAQVYEGAFRDSARGGSPSLEEFTALVAKLATLGFLLLDPP
jgi:methylase of polypeptide subunit release factors